MDTYTAVFKALSDETRLRILNLLLATEKELCACEFTDVLNITTYNISKHIKILRNANLINERKKGRWVFYSIKKDKTAFNTLIQNAISAIRHTSLTEDIESLEKRIKLRITENHPVGIQKKYLKGDSGIKCC